MTNVFHHLLDGDLVNLGVSFSLPRKQNGERERERDQRAKGEGVGHRTLSGVLSRDTEVPSISHVPCCTNRMCDNRIPIKSL